MKILALQTWDNSCELLYLKSSSPSSLVAVKSGKELVWEKLFLMPDKICPFIEKHPDLFVLFVLILVAAYATLYFCYWALASLLYHINNKGQGRELDCSQPSAQCKLHFIKATVSVYKGSVTYCYISSPVGHFPILNCSCPDSKYYILFDHQYAVCKLKFSM